MKLPRWLIVSMLAASSLAILIIAGGWWFAWPERTARKLVDLMAQDRLADVNTVVKGVSQPFLRGDDIRHAWSQVTLATEPRTVVDVVCGRQRFNLPFDGIKGDTHVKLVHTFTVQRGSVLDAKTIALFTDDQGRTLLREYR